MRNKPNFRRLAYPTSPLFQHSNPMPIDRAGAGYYSNPFVFHSLLGAPIS